MGIEPTRAASLKLENKRFGATTTSQCDGRVNFRGMWGHVGIREPAATPSDVSGSIASRPLDLHVNQTAFDNASAIRVCQLGPVAFHRANVSGGNLREIDVRALPDFGRPRGFNILAAVPALKISGNTSRALRARSF
jgi:hypothetical protein